MRIKIPDSWKQNPKLVGSGLLACIPQSGRCPINCADCFFQSNRSYLEPLEDNLPYIPSPELAEGRIVRINDGNDSNVERELVEKTAQQYTDYFFNTSIPKNLGEFSAPVVLTLNPAKMTDTNWHKLEIIPTNLMFVRVRVNSWNTEDVVMPAVDYYTAKDVPVVLTYMAYYKSEIPKEAKDDYEWRKRTLNSYWVLREYVKIEIERWFLDNPLVYSCGYKGDFSCKRCGNCIREYHNTRERMT